mmetsp:Transcript_2374/g.5475  ORF Transcript_2374/g.5475 Transcript_2374/m.5475 type:complete len:150 (+) Transcript_2374:111-560(+)
MGQHDGETDYAVELKGVGAASTRSLRPSKVMHMPCKIHHDGAADVSAYFRSAEGKLKAASILDDEGNAVSVQEATFRGRKLMGAELALPEGAEGFVLEEEHDADMTSSHWDCHAVFDKIVYWNYDRMPNDLDEARRWADWLDVSKAVHS